MNIPPPFESAATGLHPGVTLIEASAGTGKTFTIAGIILRLVLEQGMEIGKILAVTYTVAATEELRGRVRGRLRGALEDLRRGKSDDETVRKALEGGPVPVDAAILALNTAVQNFDEARIFTIHGFCQRVLRENAFESGSLFDMELLTDPLPVLDEVARDFWRRTFYDASPLLSYLALAGGESHGKLAELLNRLRNHPRLRILPEPGGVDCASLAGQLERKFGEIVAEWKSAVAEVKKILTEDKSLSRDAKAYRPDQVEKIIESVDQLAEDLKSSSPDSLKMIAKLSTSKISENPLRGNEPPKHRLFDLCEEFSVLARRYFHELTHEFIAYAQVETPLRKARLNAVTYDDLLTRMHHALTGSGGAAFAAMLGAKYRAALIDEFQDTDPLQYEIFQRIFADDAHHLYFIGDPKQAIYGFRGADVFTYLRAAREAPARFTLTTNWRSEKRLLDALNLLFERNPALGEGIEYRAVHAPEIPRKKFEALAVGFEARLRFRFLQNGNPKSKGINKDDAEEDIGRAVVADIARLKASGATLGKRGLKYGDMAVLVRKNAQAAKMQELLRARGIKSVLKTDRSVFKGCEAREMLMLLEGLLEPGRGHFLNTALATSLFGLGPRDLLALEEAESKKQQKLEQFLSYRDLWRESCFIAMFRRLLVEQRVRERLVEAPGGERGLTNFLHLAELLHREEKARRLAPDALRLWLQKQIFTDETAEEHQLRLESDDDGVLIATIHKSKGLEYPIIFCPFFWSPAGGPASSGILFHDEQAEGRLTLDLRDEGESDAHERAAADERVAESMRMLYVGLTRAQNLCHIYAGDILKFEESPLARVLGGGPPMPLLEALAETSAGTIDVTVIAQDADAALPPAPPVRADGEELRARHFQGTISQTRMIASFSSLISDSAGPESDHDESETAETAVDAVEVEIAPDAPPDLERGMRIGLFWHDLLEHLDFQKPDEMRGIAAGKLVSHGMPARNLDVVCARLRQMVKAQLQPGLALERISMPDRLAEVEFSYPVPSLTPGRIQRIFAKHGVAGKAVDFTQPLGRLKFQAVEGFMRGFIDMLFRFEGRYYLVDWKSNWLGPQPEDYGEKALRAAMLGSFYFLQYHLYTVAADLFLRRRVPDYNYDSHFGGVFYIFLRGVDAAKPDYGIYRDRPDAGLIRELSPGG